MFLFPLCKPVHVLNRTLVLWVTGSGNDHQDVWVHFAKKFDHHLDGELLTIVGVKYLGEPNDSKDFLEFVGNTLCPLPWEGSEVDEPCQVVLYGHDPPHKDSKWIPLPQLAEVNEVTWNLS
jgi:hypothetical protein